ncbi:uncharacterized protein [Antedon mediterranea]|uniref:uncharacterized protein n=1 Tax=Antedon mediterranea TaxID=105859 RepID=UPI003AF4E00B
MFINIVFLSIMISSFESTAQEIDILPFVPPSTCYTCEGETNNTACNANNVTNCGVGESCLNTVISNEEQDIHVLYKGCVVFYECAHKAKIHCVTNATTNTTACLYCCIGELCNIDEAMALGM